MSFTDGKQRKATKKDCSSSWDGNKKNFRCYICGHKFKVGDLWRFVYGLGKTINILVCDSCDNDNVLEDWINKEKQFNDEKNWALIKSLK